MSSSRTRALSPVEQAEMRQQRDMAERGRRLTLARMRHRREIRDGRTAAIITPDSDAIVPVFTLDPRLAA